MSPQNEDKTSAQAETAPLDDSLQEIRRSTGADAVLLFDRSGSLVGSSGESFDLDPVPFGSLANAHLMASVGLASLVGDVEFRALVQQGNGTAISLSTTVREWLLAAVHTGAHPSARITLPTEMNLEQLGEAIEARVLAGGQVDDEWKHAAETEIDRLFGGGA